jgi:predicted PurR-regulated permease PerM
MQRTVAQQRAMGVVAVVSFAALFWISLHVAAGLILGALIAFTLHPLYRRTARRTRRPRLAAALWTGISSVVLWGIISSLGYILFQRGQKVVGALPAVLDKAERALAPLGVPAGALIEKAKSAATNVAPKVAEYAGALTGTLYDAFIALLFTAMTTYVVLRGWPRVVRYVEGSVPLPRRTTRTILESLRGTSRHVMLGTFVTGAVQGILAGIGYAVLGVPHAAFFGAMTAVASLLPLFGTLFVWVPIGIYLLAGGQPLRGALALLWGALVVVFLCDYFIRAKLVGDARSMKLFPTFIALFGGLEVFGVSGLVLGPIVVALALEILALYRRERARGGEPRVDSGECAPSVLPSSSPRPSPSRVAAALRPPLGRLHHR